MKRETQWALLTAVPVTAAIGLAALVSGGGPAATPWSGPEQVGDAGPDSIPATGPGALGQPSSPVESGGGELTGLRRENAQLLRENAQLRRELAAATEGMEVVARELSEARVELSQTREALADAGGAREEGDFDSQGLRIRFGEAGDSQALRDLDWGEMASATRSMTDLIADLSAERRQWDAAVGREFARGTNRLWGVGIEVNGQVPTLAAGNGEYTHPIVLANLISESLDQAEAPLSGSQTEQVEALGRDYEQAFATLQEGYPEGAFALEMVLDELELKRGFSQRLREILTPQQSGALTPEAAQDVHTLDLYSPVLMLTSLAHPLEFTDSDSLPTKLAEISRWWGLSDEDLPGLSAVFDRWAAAVEPSLSEPVGSSSAKYFNLDQALAAGRAQLLVAMQDVVATYPDRVDLVNGLKGARSFMVPRRVTAGE